MPAPATSEDDTEPMDERMPGASRLAFLRPFANHVFNPIMRPLAGRLPLFAVVTQVGRRSGIVRRNPVNVLVRDGAYVIALTYGHEVNWLLNVEAAGGCEIRTRGRVVRLGPPRIFEDASATFAPQPARMILRLAGIHEFAELRPVGEPPR